MAGAASMLTVWALYPYLLARLGSRRVLTTTALAIVLLCTVVFLSADVVSSRFREIGVDHASQSRYDLAVTALQMFSKHPITGVGLNNFAEVFADYPVVRYQYQPPFHPVHNLLLLPLSETGALGFIPFALLLLFLIGETLNLARFASPAVAASLRPFAAAFAGVLVHSQVDWVVFTSCAISLMAMLAGILFAMRARELA
jgi:O-antigen ligase